MTLLPLFPYHNGIILVEDETNMPAETETVESLQARLDAARAAQRAADAARAPAPAVAAHSTAVAAHSTGNTGTGVPGSVTTISQSKAPTVNIYDGSALLAENMENQKSKEEWEKAIGEQLKKVIKDEMFRTLKFVRAHNILERAKETAYAALDYDYVRQWSGDKQRRFKANWMKHYSHLVPKKLNEHRGEVQQAVRKVCKQYWKAKKALPSTESLERILKRELSPNIEAEFELFLWWWDVVIPKAVGNVNDWHQDKRYFGRMSQHHWPKDKSKKYVTAQTEALAVWFIENNRIAWPATWGDVKGCPTYDSEEHKLQVLSGARPPEAARLPPEGSGTLATEDNPRATRNSSPKGKKRKGTPKAAAAAATASAAAAAEKDTVASDVSSNGSDSARPKGTITKIFRIKKPDRSLYTMDESFVSSLIIWPIFCSLLPMLTNILALFCF